MDLPARFLQHVRDRGLLPRRSRVVVACSGGADSVALAVLVAEHADELGRVGVVLAHLDHGLRHDSPADLRSVRAHAEALGVAFHGERREVGPGSPGRSPEEAARDVRYAFLVETARIHDAGHVVTAHHADDQAETVLQRVLRGTGPAGLAGIPQRRALAPGIELVRPLLPFRREELREFLREREIRWVEDPTNRDGNERARLRRLGIPALIESVGRDPVPLLARLAANVAESKGPLGEGVAGCFVTREADGLRLHAGFERLPRALQAGVLRVRLPHLRGGAALSRAELDRLLAGIAGSESNAVAGVALERRTRGWLLTPTRADGPDAPPPPHPIGVAAPGVTKLWDGFTIRVSIDDASNAPFLRRLATSDGSVEIVDAHRLIGALHARTRRDGDRVQPIGGTSAARLGHVLQRRGVPAPDRDRIPLICDAQGIVWAAGACMADRVRVQSGTRRIATLTLAS